MSFNRMKCTIQMPVPTLNKREYHFHSLLFFWDSYFIYLKIYFVVFYYVYIYLKIFERSLSLELGCAWSNIAKTQDKAGTQRKVDGKTTPHKLLTWRTGLGPQASIFHLAFLLGWISVVSIVSVLYFLFHLCLFSSICLTFFTFHSLCVFYRARMQFPWDIFMDVWSIFVRDSVSLVVFLLFQLMRVATFVRLCRPLNCNN